ncbi:MAG: TetR family transcriptional regulator [Roseobacter sp. MedPE-SWde]|uniref:TetR/AcrR family transcriptional regulator n=1 Tax=Roseobacter sp. MED193 TaxID=314262 RepID=UPI000068A63E|nr:TetR/AcrR family transcriptional regulator [Roseobacter sp. MED193]EAQ43427.1 possible transcriptional regulator, TetR family protein [Roseobacter sp. MED193]OIQ38673.1 MAG: TetR family transcriptional regulator [Roseobacter sp. MedPE-SWde]
MPYSSTHKEKTRTRIVEVARTLFNIHGFHGVTIDMVMAKAGLTRGGFYNHFSTKEDLFCAAVSSFLMGRGARWRHEAGINAMNPDSEAALQMIQSYLSDAHLGAVQDQCPMIALPSDVARASPEVRAAFQQLLTAMVGLLQRSLLQQEDPQARQKAMAMAALCVGGMVLARTLPECELATEIRSAALQTATAMTSSS